MLDLAGECFVLGGGDDGCGVAFGQLAGEGRPRQTDPALQTVGSQNVDGDLGNGQQGFGLEALGQVEQRL